jgi:hypothetical protein
MFAGPLTFAADPVCADLFKANKIFPERSSCLMKCLTVKVDMATFLCHNKCEEYCGKNCKSVLEDFEKKLKNGKPTGWPLSEKISSWKSSEKNLVAEALSQIPDVLVSNSNFFIYRMKKSIDHPNIATNAKMDPRSIVLYDDAFAGNHQLSRVIAHELAHIYYDKLPEQVALTYQYSTNWFSFRKSGSKDDLWISRKEGFVQPDGRVSPEEDFANNLEFYLFDPQKLKTVTPHAYEWIRSNVNALDLRKGCKYEK